jgi:DNA-binding GntR family transcriptional regulator
MLNEETLKKELQISRTPIRDALSRLEQENLITIKSKKGILVSEFTVEDINSIFETRLLYERYALTEYGNNLDEIQLASFYQAYSLSNEKQDRSFTMNLDATFHTFIMSPIKNTYILHSYDMVSIKNKRLRILTGSTSQKRLLESDSEHLVIVRYCIEKQWAKAADALTVHLMNAKLASFDLLREKTSLIPRQTSLPS